MNYKCNARLPSLPWVKASCNCNILENDDDEDARSISFGQLTLEEKFNKVCVILTPSTDSYSFNNNNTIVDSSIKRTH
jgi:hypothetical protein